MAEGARAQKRWSLPCPHCRAALDLPDPERVQGRDYRVPCMGPPEPVAPLDSGPVPRIRVAHIALFERVMWAEPGGLVRWAWKVGVNDPTAKAGGLRRGGQHPTSRRKR